MQCRRLRSVCRVWGLRRWLGNGSFRAVPGAPVVFAGVYCCARPDERSRRVEVLSARGNIVCFVADGRRLQNVNAAKGVVVVNCAFGAVEVEGQLFVENLVAVVVVSPPGVRCTRNNGGRLFDKSDVAGARQFSGEPILYISGRLTCRRS